MEVRTAATGDGRETIAALVQERGGTVTPALPRAAVSARMELLLAASVRLALRQAVRAAQGLRDVDALDLMVAVLHPEWSISYIR